MNPNELSKHLRSMADKLDRSKNPSASLVRSEFLAIAADLQSESYESELNIQETESPRLPGSRRPATVSVDVSRDDAFSEAMNGFKKRASR